MAPRFTVGSVPYVNAIPLVLDFERWGEASPVRVVYDVPSRLPVKLDSGEVDAILVSSFDALTVPCRRVAAGVCIGSRGAVKSVRLFSKVPFDQIQTLALDQSSMTSNALAQIVLAEAFGVRPETTRHAPSLETMLAETDACVIIGDAGMEASGEGLHVLDLGSAWHELTGKPFVWAAWVGGERLTPELATVLRAAANPAPLGELGPPESDFASQAEAWVAEWSPTSSVEQSAYESAREARLQQWIVAAQQKVGWPEPVIRDYFESVMEYAMDEDMLDGLREYARRLDANGFATRGFPELVERLGLAAKS